MIYVASPYSHPDKNIREQRFYKVTIFVANLVSKGYCAISPITYGHTLLEFKDMPTDFEFWNNFCISLLSKSDLLYVYKIDGWNESKGLKEEIKYAKENNIPIVYINEEIPDIDNLRKKDIKYFDKTNHYGEIFYLAKGGDEYNDNMGFYQFGECNKCDIKLTSWSKDAECPKCGRYKHLT